MAILQPEDLFKNNVRWAERMNAKDPDFFPELAKQQAPDYLWIGCSDSRVPANEIVGMRPGELFVHRNVANVVCHTDLNCLSVLNFAIDVLQVEHVIVCGHYGCGGVKAALNHQPVGIADYWLRNIRDVYFYHRKKFTAGLDETESVDQLCELNVRQQQYNVAHTNVVQNAWQRGQPLSIHAWIYSIKDGLLKQLAEPISSLEEIAGQYRIDTNE